MLRSPLLVIGHILTVDILGLVQKMVGGPEYNNTGSYSRRSLPFSPLTRFSPSPPPLLPAPLFAPATQTKRRQGIIGYLPEYLQDRTIDNPFSQRCQLSLQRHTTSFLALNKTAESVVSVIRMRPGKMDLKKE